MTGAPPKPSDCQKPLPGAPVIGFSDLFDRIFCGASEEVLSGFPDACIDLIVTSPPYDTLRSYGGHEWNWQTFVKVAEQLERVLAPGGVLVWVVADEVVRGSETGTSMRQALWLKDLNLRLHDTMVWLKHGAMPQPQNRYNPEWEYMFVLSKGTPKTFNPIREDCVLAGKKHRVSRQEKDESAAKRCNLHGRVTHETKVAGNVWVYQNNFSRNDLLAYEHPATFPMKLASDHIASWSNPGDVVLDPFCGSGTTVRAAKNLNRRYVGIEVNPEYVELIKTRLAQEVLALA